MKCPHCQYEGRPGAKFCEECGSAASATCAGCGAELSPNARFCSQCGRPAAAAARSASLATPLPEAPAGYTPKHLTEKILGSKASLEGERRQVTALFADLKGSMELFADRDPEEARRLLDPVLEHMMEAVHRYEGTVNHVLGDGIVALFGAPLAHEDHAIRGCYAALRMQETVKRYAEGVRRTEGIPIQVRVGLNSGEVVVRSIGNDLRMDYTVVGQTTNIAARMEQMAMPGSILISPETLALAEGYVRVEPLGPVTVKGLDQPMEVFELREASVVRSRLHAAAARGLTRFVGRENEIDQLHQALDRIRTGNGQVVAVVGEAGAGKSRLYWEFTRSHRLQGCLVVESSSVSYGKATSFLPIVDLLRGYFRIEPGDEPRKIREKLTGRLLSLDRLLEPSLPALLWLLDVPPDDPQWQRLDASQRRQRALEDVKRLLLRESQVQPVVALFEDLHWIDAETQAFLDRLVESLPTARLLLLVNYRPEYHHEWGGKSYYRQLTAEALALGTAAELLQDLLGDDTSLEPLKRLVIERTEGNPFFLEETIRTLVETKALVGARGAYRLARASDSLQIPATAQAILAARIDRLSPEDKRLLQAASVIGKDVPFELLAAIAELSEDSLRSALGRLQAAEFLYEARLFPDLEYTFKHALTHDVTYGGLLQERRRVLHGRIVEALERLHPDRLAEHVERLAEHAFRGEMWEKAVGYQRQAGAKALARSAHREAADRFERATTALKNLPETRERLELAVDLLFDLRNALWALGAFEALAAILREAEHLARRLDDPRRLGWVGVYMSANLWITGRSAQSRAYVDDASTIGEALQELPLQIAADFYLGTTLATSGEYRSAEDALLAIVRRLEGERSLDRCGLPFYPAVLARSWLVWSLAERGEFDEGIASGHEGTRLAELLDHPYSLAHIGYDLGYLHIVRGEVDQAVRLLERSLGLTREWHLSFLLPVMTWLAGHAYVRAGRTGDGLPMLEEAQSTFQSMGSGAFQALALVHLAEAYAAADRTDEAWGAGQRALALARERGQRSYEAHALRLVGEIAASGDRPGAAEAALREASALANELGMRPLAAHCQLGLGELAARSGKLQERHHHLAAAAAMYREMGMGAFLGRADAGMRVAG